MQYLFKEGEHFVFMDTKSFEQTHVDEKGLGEAKNYLKENENAKVLFWNGRAISVAMPNAVELKVTKCDPGVRGDTVSGALKPATMETGYTLNVPLFINEGDTLRIDTRTGAYITRDRRAFSSSAAPRKSCLRRPSPQGADGRREAQGNPEGPRGHRGRAPGLDLRRRADSVFAFRHPPASHAVHTVQPRPRAGRPGARRRAGVKRAGPGFRSDHPSSAAGCQDLHRQLPLRRHLLPLPSPDAPPFVDVGRGSTRDSGLHRRGDEADERDRGRAAGTLVEVWSRTAAGRVRPDAFRVEPA